MAERFAGDKKEGVWLLHSAEKRLQPRLARMVPSWIQTYHLTLCTLLWSALTLLSGYLAQDDIAWLWLSSAAIAGQYLTDLVDGEVGRQRNTGLIQWGYYMDHLLDYVFLFAYLGSFVFLVPPELLPLHFALLGVAGCFMVNAFLAFAATNRFQISAFGVGPTEVRILFILLNTACIIAGAESIAGGLPWALGLTSFALIVTVWRTQRQLWGADMAVRKS